MLINSELTDKQIFELFRKGNLEAFNLLYRRYWKKLLYKALQKLDSDEDAEEIVQDIFIDLWNSRGRIEINTSVHLYLSAMLRYKIMTRIARQKKQMYCTTTDINTITLQDNSTEHWLSFEDTKAHLENVINSLPEKCQIIFRMSREESLTNRQIAEDLGVSQKNVEAHISRALKTLKISLKRFFIFLP